MGKKTFEYLISRFCSIIETEVKKRKRKREESRDFDEHSPSNAHRHVME